MYNYTETRVFIQTGKDEPKYVSWTWCAGLDKTMKVLFISTTMPEKKLFYKVLSESDCVLSVVQGTCNLRPDFYDEKALIIKVSGLSILAETGLNSKLTVIVGYSQEEK